jgi:uncharacterized protein
MIRRTVQWLWRLLALLCVALGLVGAVLPVLPTVPFLLLAAFAAGRGWPALEAWLLRHPRFGPPITRWRERGAVPRSAKWAATLGMSASAAIIAFTSAPAAVKWGVPLAMACVAVWLWRRPES